MKTHNAGKFRNYTVNSILILELLSFSIHYLQVKLPALPLDHLPVQGAAEGKRQISVGHSTAAEENWKPLKASLEVPFSHEDIPVLVSRTYASDISPRSYNYHFLYKYARKEFIVCLDSQKATGKDMAPILYETLSKC